METVQNIYHVYDSTAESWGPPMLFAGDPVAVRAFEHQARDENSTICRSPEDFTLYRVGTFELTTGEYDLIPPVCVSKGVEAANG